jgi:HK97 family phage prohead protease
VTENRSLAEALPKRESRAVASLEIRSSGDGLTLEGYASTTEQPYDMGWYSEVIRSGAFTKTLAEADDVRLLVNHDGIPLARTKSGTMRLFEDSTGLGLETKLAGDSPLVATVRSAMDRGDLDEMSFGFTVTRQSWSPDYDQRDIQEVRLFDVSVVTYPANPTTSAKLRAADLMQMLDKMDAEEQRAMLAHLEKQFAPAATPTLDRLRALAASL